MLDCGTSEWGYQLVSGSVLTLKNHNDVIQVMVIIVVVIVVVTVTFINVLCKIFSLLLSLV